MIIAMNLASTLTQVHFGERLVATLLYEKEKNPYIMANINRLTSEIFVNKEKLNDLEKYDEAIQLVEVEVYGKIWPSE